MLSSYHTGKMMPYRSGYSLGMAGQLAKAIVEWTVILWQLWN